MSPAFTLPSNALYQAELDKARTQVPAGKTGQASVLVTKEGLTGTVAVRPFGGFQVEGWAQRQWGAGGWAAGARATYTW